MKQLETINGVQNFFLYNGEKVFVYDNLIEIGEKSFRKKSSDIVFYANGLLLVEGYEIRTVDEIVDQDDDCLGISVYNGERFVPLECGYKQNQYRHFYAPDVFCHAEVNEKDENYKVVFSERGVEYAFVDDCNGNLFDFFYNTKHQVLVFIHYGFHIFFSKTGEELWYLEMSDGFEMYFDVESFDPDSDGYIIKVKKNNKPYTVCYNVQTGDVMWEREDNYSLFLGGVKCEDGIRRGLLGHDGNNALLFEVNPDNGESEIFLLKEGLEAVKFEGTLNETVEHYYLYTLQGDKLYFVKNYTNYLLNDCRERTVGVVDLKARTISEDVCCTSFCFIKAPLVDGNVLYAFFNHPKKEVLSFDISCANTEAVEKKAPAGTKSLSGNYSALLQGDKLFYVFEEDAFAVNLKQRVVCQRFVPEKSTFTPLTATILQNKLCVLSASFNDNNECQTERKEYDVAETVNEKLDGRVNVALLESLVNLRGVYDVAQCYKLFFYNNKAYLLSNVEILVVDLDTKAMEERIVLEGRFIYPESTILNGNMLCVYMKKASVGMYYFNLDEEHPFRSIANERFKPKNSSEEYQLGYYLSTGEAGFQKDEVKAFEWFARSALHGHMAGEFELANCYSKGIGVAQSYENAVKWWAKSAVHGFLKAQYNLAECYEKGRGTAKNLIKAIIWYIELAENGNEESKEALDRIKSEGHVELDIVYAGKGDVEAQYRLAVCYETGNGIEQSASEASRWYAKAAEAGHAKALEAIGRQI